jgi:tripartite-type tricarboxylate transporter receptor subunit TctC
MSGYFAGKSLRTGAVLAAVSLSCLASPAQAQSYPTKTVRFVIPYAAGGTADIIGRIVGQKLSEDLGKQFLIDNRVGATGNLGAEFVAKSPPDGYTLMLMSNSHTVNAALYSKVGYDIVRDFSPISLTGITPLVLVVHPSLPVHNVKDLVDLAKAHPGQMFFSSSGNGSAPHLAGQLFNGMTGVNMVHVPYKGNTEATTDLVSGQVQVMFSPINSVFPQLKAGRLRPVAMTGAKRSPAAPEIPTFVESGFPGYVLVSWTGVIAPTGTPRDVIAQLHGEIEKAVSGPDVKEKFFSQGVEAASNTPDEFSAFIKAELARWAKVVKESGAKVD